MKHRRRVSAALALLLVFALFQLLNTATAGRPGTLAHTVKGVLETWGAALEGDSQTTTDLTGRVVRIADGDTVTILDAANRQHKVRLYGIDAPERDQPFGKAARNELKQLVAEKPVNVVIVATDKYGRKVGTLYQHGININIAMVAGGYAWWYQHFAPDERGLQKAEAQAREQGLALWSAPHPIPPWEWRRGRR